ncbi:YkgJ family cysteine cluster protein [Paraburkholderia phenazinium]|jgi:Fe-S-cluster containining protein|uniref:Putative zinc-or iron-chelating domain-containing protein n=1 Tax=Paraburkholderia phenazinium TaxID=60549 RepID=A0A1G7RUI2_9BURK|nr:YkgJ family cysteine cluster protein [Paraburkholderia phenazinium]SDG14401.1 Putative zinc-or iron-chelating domain-containing protein [Paraburkholderia phenazinium]
MIKPFRFLNPEIDMTTDLNFACTMCGDCCHNLRLPLSVNEAIRWLERGGDVQVFCEAIPWPVEPSTDDGQVQHRRIRSFAAESGELAIRVMVTVVAAFDGACPHLQPDMRCGGYEARPNVCRIYPAEVNPFIELMPTHKACPPEAWAVDRPSFIKGGRIMDSITADLIQNSREAAVDDVPVKERLCGNAGFRTASLANEGFVTYTLPPRAMLDELYRALDPASPATQAVPWRILSNRRTTVDTLNSVGAHSEMHTALLPTEGYIPLFEAN